MASNGELLFVLWGANGGVRGMLVTSPDELPGMDLAPQNGSASCLGATAHGLGFRVVWRDERGFWSRTVDTSGAGEPVAHGDSALAWPESCALVGVGDRDVLVGRDLPLVAAALPRASATLPDVLTEIPAELGLPGVQPVVGRLGDGRAVVLWSAFDGAPAMRAPRLRWVVVDP
jgi:hypothetical protein